MNSFSIQTLRQFKKARSRKYFSQSGEDGLLEYVLSCLPHKDKWCVEFGAWDGRYLSNTYHFIQEKKYKAVLIEGQKDRYIDLCRSMADLDSICINAMVGFKDDDRLDVILSKTSIPKDFDLLSIDIDGDDYFVWQALENYSPKVVIIEINICDKPSVDRLNVSQTPFQWGVSGTSIKTMTELANRKGYKLIAHIGCNAIYIRNDLYPIFFTEPINLKDLFTYEGHEYSDLNKSELASANFWIPNFYLYFIPFRPRTMLNVIGKKIKCTMSKYISFN